MHVVGSGRITPWTIKFALRRLSEKEIENGWLPSPQDPLKSKDKVIFDAIKQTITAASACKTCNGITFPELIKMVYAREEQHGM